MKAVLVLDEMPKCCDDCQLNYDLGFNCDALPMIIETPVDKREMHNEDKRPSWCPLKEMPKKRGKMFLTERSQNDTDLMVKSAFANCYTDGWNECIEEIEK